MKDFCIYGKKCNSCQLCNLSYTEQLRYKENLCRRLIAPMCPVEPITPSPRSEGYRNKARMLTQALRMNADITDQRNKFF